MNLATYFGCAPQYSEFRLRGRKNCVLYYMSITIYNKQKGLLKLILLMYLEVNESLTTDVDVSVRFNYNP
jgi:hypothetical protein